jgi:hypothetical protein
MNAGVVAALAWFGFCFLAGTGVLVIGAQIGATRKRRAGGLPAPGDGHQTPAPEPGHPPEATSPPSVAAPAPALLPHELEDLNRLHRRRTPLGHNAGQVIADGLRQRFPQYDDAVLGAITTDLYGYARALELALSADCADARYVVDCLGLAAEELTHLARVEEVRFDQP